MNLHANLSQRICRDMFLNVSFRFHAAFRATWLPEYANANAWKIQNHFRENSPNKANCEQFSV